MAQISSSFILRPAIVTNDSYNAKILKSSIESTNNLATSIELENQINLADNLFRHKGCNCLFIDIFTYKIKSTLEFINHIRNTYPVVPICLYSKRANLSLMPEVDSYWRNRFEHYFKLAADEEDYQFIDNTQHMLRAMLHYLQNDTALIQVSDLAKRLQEAPGKIVFEQEQKTEFKELLSMIEQLLKTRPDIEHSNLISIQEIKLGNHFEIGNIIDSNVNIASTLERANQTVESRKSIDESNKNQLINLVEQLKLELQRLSVSRKEDAEAIAEYARALIEAGSKEHTNKAMVQITADGLRKAAENIASISSPIFTIVTTIIKIINQVADR